MTAGFARHAMRAAMAAHDACGYYACRSAQRAVGVALLALDYAQTTQHGVVRYQQVIAHAAALSETVAAQ